MSVLISLCILQTIVPLVWPLLSTMLALQMHPHWVDIHRNPMLQLFQLYSYYLETFSLSCLLEDYVHNDPQYKLRMVADDSTIKTSRPSLIDTRNSSSMSMETWLLKFVRKLLCYKKQMANLEVELKNMKERLHESENETNEMVAELRETKELANAGLSPTKGDQVFSKLKSVKD
ncbi:hypothetical protein Tco_1148171 [Tanacetum coccineum]